MPSLFRVVLHTLGEDLPVDFGCMCLYEASAAALSIAVIDPRSAPLAVGLGLTEFRPGADRPERTGALCRGASWSTSRRRARIKFPFPQRFAQAGVHALVIAPLLVEIRFLV